MESVGPSRFRLASSALDTLVGVCPLVASGGEPPPLRSDLPARRRLRRIARCARDIVALAAGPNSDLQPGQDARRLATRHRFVCYQDRVSYCLSAMSLRATPPISTASFAEHDVTKPLPTV